MESALEEGIHVFKLAELHAAHENRLKNLNIDFSANRTRLKGKLLDYFQYNGIQVQSGEFNFSNWNVFPLTKYSRLFSDEL